jgi:hypothetical protein
MAAREVTPRGVCLAPASVSSLHAQFEIMVNDAGWTWRAVLLDGKPVREGVDGVRERRVRGMCWPRVSVGM